MVAARLCLLGFTVVFVLATVSVFGAISALTLNSEMLMRVGGVRIDQPARVGVGSDIKLGRTTVRLMA